MEDAFSRFGSRLERLRLFPEAVKDFSRRVSRGVLSVVAVVGGVDLVVTGTWEVLPVACV